MVGRAFFRRPQALLRKPSERIYVSPLCGQTALPLPVSGSCSSCSPYSLIQPIWRAGTPTIGHVFIDHRTCADKGESAYGDAADDGAVRAQRRTGFDQSVAVFAFALNQRTGVVDIGEYHAGAAKHAVFQVNVVVHGNVVLDFAVIADGHFVADEHVLAERAVFADFRAAADVGEMPDAAARADLRAFVDNGGGVDGVVHFPSPLF